MLESQQLLLLSYFAKQKIYASFFKYRSTGRVKICVCKFECYTISCTIFLLHMCPTCVPARVLRSVLTKNSLCQGKWLKSKKGLGFCSGESQRLTYRCLYGETHNPVCGSLRLRFSLPVFSQILHTFIS